MNVFISRPELWQKLIERKQENINSGVDSFHINMGINQAIGIMNSMEAYELPLCPNCGEKSEMAFMLEFARTQDFDFEVNIKQLRSLWTAYCIRHDYEPDTAKFDDDINWIWHSLQENNSVPWHDDEEGIVGYELFYADMCEEVL
jgi:hypothetical protein